MGTITAFLAGRLARVLYHSWKYRGGRVLELGPQEPEVREKVREAIDLIVNSYPLAWRRLARAKGVLVLTRLPADTGGQYWPGFNGSALNSARLAGWSASTVASIIIHEVTHAFLFHRGLKVNLVNRHRVEAVCAREEIEFARRTGDSALLRVIATREAWRDNFNREEEPRTVAFLNSIGLPRPLVWLHRLLFRARAGSN